MSQKIDRYKLAWKCIVAYIRHNQCLCKMCNGSIPLTMVNAEIKRLEKNIIRGGVQ